MDILLLRALLNRKSYESFKDRIPWELIADPTRILIQWIGAYYTTNPNASQVASKDLLAYVKLRNKDKLDDDGVKLLLSMVERLHGVPEPDTPTIWNNLVELDFAGRVGALYERYDIGGEVDILNEIDELVGTAKRLRIDTAEQEHDIGDILEEIQQRDGLVFKSLAILRDYVMPMRGGESVALAARPDAGKSSVLCQLVTDAAPSVVSYFGEERPILFLINEGNERRLLPRLYQAALKATLSEVYGWNKDGTLIDRYEAAIGASRHYIKALPIHGFTIYQVEELLERYNPSVVVIDMVEHIQIPNIHSKAERITALWEWKRTMAIQYNYISFGTVQIGESGSNTLYPSYDHLNYSKTGIQAAADLIVMMGSLNNSEHRDLRGFSTPKNKLSVEGMPSYAEAQALFDKDRCHFEDGSVSINQTEVTTSAILEQANANNQAD